MVELRDMFEKDMRMIASARGREKLMAEIAHHRQHLQEIVEAQTAELKKSKELLEERLRFEELVGELSAWFANISPELVEGEISRALDKICQFSAADHCGMLQVATHCRQIFFVNLNGQKQAPRRPLDINITTNHPWLYKKLIERGEEVCFNSLDVLPAEAATDRATWEKVGVRSALLIPLRISMETTYVIGLWNHAGGREWPTTYIHRLRLLGEIFAKALAHRRDQESLIESERMLSEAQRVAHVGSWDWDIINGTHHWSDEFYRILGLPPRESEATYEAFLASVHPDDRHAVDQANNAAIAGPEKTYAIEYRVVRPDDIERAVHARGEVLFDQDLRPVRMIGTLYDITERKHSEEVLRKAFDEINQLKERLEAENIYLQKEIASTEGFTDIVGATSDPIRYVLFRIRQVARTKATVLLTGETGTGKGVFAHAIHEASDRKGKPFVHVNCAGLPPSLIENELYGREKGAFTGASAKQIGRFDLANGGTLFLDEIGELAPGLQAKLLKVIEDGEFERLGSPHPVKVDVRIIASTNRDLEEEIKAGRFRKDLFYRLNVFPISIPPLRQRREDIPFLAKFFAEKFSKGYRKHITKIPKQIMKALENYAWPGNVRELINVIERAVIVSDGPELRLAEEIDALPACTAQEHRSKGGETREPERLSEVERQHVLMTLKKTGWRIAGDKGAAQLLGMNPSTLKARMRKLGIERPKIA